MSGYAEGCKGIKTPNTQVSTFSISPTTLFKGSDVTNSNIIVRSKWQEISSTEWIIGVELENVGPRSVASFLNYMLFIIVSCGAVYYTVIGACTAKPSV